MQVLTKTKYQKMKKKSENVKNFYVKNEQNYARSAKEIFALMSKTISVFKRVFC